MPELVERERSFETRRLQTDRKSQSLMALAGKLRMFKPKIYGKQQHS